MEDNVMYAKPLARIVSRRDSATAMLRKIGIKQRDYDYYIKTTDDGKFIVDIALAKKTMGDLGITTKEELEVHKTIKTSIEVRQGVKIVDRSAGVGKLKVIDKRELPPPNTGESLTAYSCRMILDGYTNTELWMAMNQHFGEQPAKKRSYPRWYRRFLRNKGHDV